MPVYVKCTDTILLTRYMALNQFCPLLISGFLIRCVVTHTALTHCHAVTKALFMTLATESTITNYLPGSLVSFKILSSSDVCTTTSKLLLASISIILHYSHYWFFYVIFSKLFTFSFDFA